MMTFEERVQALPAEIYNEIHDLTFKTAPSVVCINKHYRPPALLQVNRASRKDFAKLYYGHDTVFYVNRGIAPKWLRSIDTAGFKIHGDVRIANSLSRANPMIVTGLVSLLLAEWYHLVGARLGMLVNPPTHLRSLVSYGESEKKVWVGLHDLPQGRHMGGWTNKRAGDWCEWKFG